jgi:alkaline phosphatase
MARLVARKTGLVLVAVLLLAGFAYLLRPDLFGQDPEPRETAALLAVARGEAPPRLPAPEPGRRAKSAVVMIGDGLGFAGIEASRLLNRGIGGHLQLDRFPVAGFSTTRSAIEVVTDSGAGATAIATGHKTLNGRLGVDATGNSLRTLAELAKAQGKAVGLITDSYMWDATPGGFAVHQTNRRKYLEIALELAGRDFDLLIGCETRRVKEDDDDQGPIVQKFLAEGWQVGRDLDWLEKAGPGKALALLPGGSMSPQKGSSQLARAVALAIARLEQDPEGYFLLIESEETDTGGHDNDLEQVARGVEALDFSLERVFAAAERDGETLVVFTSDHETGGLAILGGTAGEPLEYRFATDGHNAEPVPLLAYGPGAERFAGSQDNTEVGRDLAGALGLDFGVPVAP